MTRRETNRRGSPVVDGLTERLDVSLHAPERRVRIGVSLVVLVVSAVDPNRLVGLSDEPALESMAAEADDRFARVLSALAET